ncbi:hypothetical protein SLEP1_g43755 [Rubroshorea leprosula]|uniref:DUF4378 domain-containing protein n=1 Tax=Rubroshorea leprosula TaxID=152421 RepID=A0AAV5LET7_9ROSI|nr:hypothetical protein SLEP1_g43755 [Rubroshorea leprosula]
MAAKLLQSLADDNPDLQKQIGCMTGIFQLFDRHHVVAARRLSHKRLTAGTSHLQNGILESDSNDLYCPGTTEMNTNNSVKERQRISIESSRASSSSSCSSSLSSLECNKTVQEESSSFDRIIFPETPSRDPVMNQSSTSPRLGRQSLDLRDVVKDSMYREARGLSVKTAGKDEVVRRNMKHKDSPRPLQLSKSVSESYGVGISEKHVPADLKESLRVLAKLQEAPWYYNNEGRELPRTSYEANGSWNSISRDSPRLSYDGREINRFSFESRDSLKSMPKLKELPRLSLDSREGSMRGSNHLSIQSGGNLMGAQKRPSNVVAKLMGLETLPDSTEPSDNLSGLIKSGLVEGNDPFSRSLRASDANRLIRTPISPRTSMKDPTSPRWKNPDLVMKPISSSRFPIEPAPWKQLDASRVSQRQANKAAEVPAKPPNSFPSVYSEIEKRLKDLEFKQSGKDLRALKQIIEAMQAKGLLQTQKNEQASNLATPTDYEAKCRSPNQNMRGDRSPQKNNVTTSIRSSNSVMTFDSPIVIMKPAKLVEKAGIPASSVIPIDGLSNLHKIQSGGLPENRKGSKNGQTAKDHAPKNSCSNSVSSSTAKRTASKNIRATQSSTKPPKENPTTSIKNSGSVSPRLQQKKVELDRLSRPPTPPDSSKPGRQSNKYPLESSSPGDKRRAKSHNIQLSDDQLSQISNESRTSSYQGDDISVQSDSNITLESKIDVEVTSINKSIEVYESHNPSMKASKYSVSGLMQKESTPRLGEYPSQAELAMVDPEHPSPVSVLDASVYKDDALSPVKQILNSPEAGDGAQDHNYSPEEQWCSADGFLSRNVSSGPASEINRQKLQNIEHLVQKLTRLNSNHDEASTDYIALLCENKNPDHRYISEILLASGLLLRDLSSGLSKFQLHPSGHPINPELFFVLEQTKASSLLLKEESNAEKVNHSKLGNEKFHRKLIFDVVNEILVRKLALVGASPEPWVKSTTLAKKTSSAQKLLKELCTEVEQLQAKKLESILEVEEHDLKTVLWEDVMLRSESWTEFHGEISGIVLDIERMVFKDLVSETVIGEAANLLAKKSRRRQLFAK